MSLRDAVKEIADQIEIDAKGYSIGSGSLETKRLLTGFVRQLRTALKSSEFDEQQQQRGQMLNHALAQSIAIPGVVGQDGKFHSKHYNPDGVQSIKEESTSETMTTAVGGPADQAMSPISSAMPVGAKTLLAGGIYQLQNDRNLHYLEDETKKLIEDRQKKEIINA